MKYKTISLSLLFICVCLATLGTGDIGWASVWDGIYRRLFENATEWNPLLDERLPRLIVLLSTGASLAVAGAVMQAIFQNPLAAPSVLGINAGGALCVITVFILGLASHHIALIPLAAVLGCFLTLMLVYALSQWQGRGHLTTLILTGVAVSTVLLALQGAFLYAMREHWELIQTITEWESGSTLDRSWNHVHMQLPLALVGLTGCLFYRNELNLLALGEEEAQNLGVDVAKVRWRLFLCVSLLTGGALASLGSIAFFGLILPHLIRSLIGSDNRSVVPFCLVGGAITLASLDLAMRLLGIRSLSIGNISAMIGGVFFLVLLFRSQKQYAEAI